MRYPRMVEATLHPGDTLRNDYTQFIVNDLLSTNEE